MKRLLISINEYNYLKDDESYLLEEHVNYCYNFREGFGIVRYYDNTYNLVNPDGKTLLKNNVNSCCDFYNGFAFLLINHVWYRINSECNFYSEDNISFKELYCLYPNMRSELIEIISKYTYFDIEEYFI